MRREGGVAVIVATVLGVAGSVTTGAFAAPVVDIPPAEGASTGEPAPAPGTSETAPDKAMSGANGPVPSAGAVPRPQDTPFPGTIGLKVDVTDIERHIFGVHETIPAQPGPLTLLYPEWLPGNHAPRGPIDEVAGLLISANGKRLDWSRDPLNIYAFRVQAPAGANHLDVEFQFTAPLTVAEGRINVTPDIVGLQWNTVVLYPAGYYASRISVAPELTLPEAWEFGSALDVASRHGSTVSFKHVSLEMLVDSPVFAGRYFRSVILDPAPMETPTAGRTAPRHTLLGNSQSTEPVVRLDIVADSLGSLEIKPEQIAAHRTLVQEAYALFGSRHFDHYDLLLALSDQFGEIGLEHHRSSENRRTPGYFTDWDKEGPGRSILPHELTHSWNGKYRRPAGLATPNFNVPMQNGLLWVYEGLDPVPVGTVLAARFQYSWSAGFRAPGVGLHRGQHASQPARPDVARHGGYDLPADHHGAAAARLAVLGAHRGLLPGRLAHLARRGYQDPRVEWR